MGTLALYPPDGLSPSLRAKRSNPRLSKLRDGLLRGACHRARIRATRWLAMTMWRQWGATKPLVGQITQNLSSPLRKNIPLNMSGKSAA